MKGKRIFNYNLIKDNVSRLISCVLLLIFIFTYPLNIIATTNLGLEKEKKQNIDEKYEIIETKTYTVSGKKNNYETLSDTLEGKFFYEGVPEGEAVKRKGLIEWIIENVGQILDYILGVMTAAITISVNGWLVLLEEFLNQMIQNISGTQHLNEYRKMNQLYYIDEKGNINIENIVLNRIPILNVDFFETEEEILNRMVSFSPSGLKYTEEEKQELEQIKDELKKTPMFILRKHFKNVYTLTYGASIIIFLLALIFSAIMGVFSSTARDKAKYKMLFTEWLKAFITMFFIILFLIAIPKINSYALKMLEKVVDKQSETDLFFTTDYGQKNTIMETLRTRALSFKLSVSVPATIMAVMLFRNTVKFLIMYTRRLIMVYIYGILGPIISAVDLFQKIITGKSSIQENWMKEYMFLILIQTLQASMLIGVLTTVYKLLSISIVAIVVFLIIIKMLFELETMVRNIFGFKSNLKHSSLENFLTVSSVRDIATAGIIINTTKKHTQKAKAKVKKLKDPVVKLGKRAIQLGYNTSEKIAETIKENKEINEQLRREGYEFKLDPAVEFIKKQKQKADKAIVDFSARSVLKKQGYSKKQIKELLNEKSRYGLTREQKQQLIMVNKGNRAYKTKEGVKRTAKLAKNTLDSIARDENGKKRIRFGDYVDSDGEIQKEEKWREKIKEGFGKTYKKAIDEYTDELKSRDDDFKKQVGKTQEDAVAMLLTTLCVPIEALNGQDVSIHEQVIDVKNAKRSNMKYDIIEKDGKIILEKKGKKKK